MVKMNKTEVLKRLKEETNYNEDMCLKINDIFKRHMLIGKKNKEQIINDLEEELKIENNDANKIYETFMSIIMSGIKEKIKNPFKDQDK